MTLLANIAIVVITIIAMEGAATFIHRYVMHGPGWGWHRSHHEPHDHVFERNDLYAVLFAALTLGLIIMGERGAHPLYWVGVGMSLYGLLYFVVHDGLTHQRWPFRYKPRHPYLKRLVQAHRLHHATQNREGGVSFGFLYAPPVRHLKQELQAQRSQGYNLDTQQRIGLGLAALVIVSWLAVHIYGVFIHSLQGWGVIAALLLIALQTWLSVGLFIIAHDAMHGSLAPATLKLNHAMGRLCLLLYAGFWYDALLPKHHAHHRHAGTADDPDFDEDNPDKFWPWYVRFFREYFGWPQAVFLTLVTWIYVLILKADLANVLLFWALPAILSSMQLFYFGTYRPHRHPDVDLSDPHRARSEDFKPWLSLITCFHFGYHDEHHRFPKIPWWRLPRVRRLNNQVPSLHQTPSSAHPQ